MRVKLLSVVMVAALSMMAINTQAADKKKGGIVGNNYASQMDQIDETTLRITTRKKVTGDLEEVNKPGTTVNKALTAVSNGGSVRAAIEAKALGYSVFQVQGVRNLSQTQEKRSASVDHGSGAETSYTFAPGHYTNDIELAVEMTVKLIPGEFPANAPEGYVSVDQILVSAGLAEMVTK